MRGGPSFGGPCAAVAPARSTQLCTKTAAGADSPRVVRAGRRRLALSLAGPASASRDRFAVRGSRPDSGARPWCAGRSPGGWPGPVASGSFATCFCAASPEKCVAGLRSLSVGWPGGMGRSKLPAGAAGLLCPVAAVSPRRPRGSGDGLAAEAARAAAGAALPDVLALRAASPAAVLPSLGCSAVWSAMPMWTLASHPVGPATKAAKPAGRASHRGHSNPGWSPEQGLPLMSFGHACTKLQSLPLVQPVFLFEK